jgi:hypothetical protein
MDTSALALNGGAPMILDAGDGDVLTVAHDARGFHLVRYSPELQVKWERRLAATPGQDLMRSGIHLSEGKLLVPVLTLHPEGVTEYKLHSFVISTGDSIPATQLLRLNNNDVGGFANAFARERGASDIINIAPAWSPDSSKILLFKKYPGGGDRMSVELTLFKRGYTLISKTNVDFRFDTNKQELVSVLLDNDGVAYFVLRNTLDQTVEVGRFEIIGSRRLKTIMYKSNAVIDQGVVAVAPRGHVYLATLTEEAGASNCKLIDFDFYQDRAIAIDVAEFAKHGGRADRLQLFALGNEGRVIVSHDRYHGSDGATNSLIAYDLDRMLLWRSSHEKPIVRDDRSNEAEKTIRIENSLGYLHLEQDTLKVHRTSIVDGAEQSDAIAILRGVGQSTIDLARQLNGRIYLPLDRLTRFSMP